jgi:hypothetical protein
LAPIGLSVYSRLAHVQQAVRALQSDPLAAASELTVFSDGPAPGDEAAIRDVREFLRGIAGFKRVNLVLRDRNDRVANNRGGMRALLHAHGRMIWVEEDIVIAPGFLGFMNAALDAYEKDMRIFSVCGYRPPFALPPTYRHDVFALPRFSAWGFATWRDRFDLVRMKISRAEYFRFLLNPARVLRFARGGADMLNMLHSEVHGVIDALDVKIFFQQFNLGMNTLYPTRFLVSNIGHDGTGLHCVNSSRFDVDLQDSADYAFAFPDGIEIDEGILRANKRFRDPGLLRKLKFPARVARDLFKAPKQRPQGPDEPT